MLSFDVRELAQHAVPVSGSLPPEDPIWQDVDVAPSGAVLVSGRLSAAGEGRYYWKGRFDGTSAQDCRRCLEPVVVAVSEEFRALFAESDAEEVDDPDVYAVNMTSSTLDLRPAVREHWMLNAPRFALCREDCRGLCPVCGENRNFTECGCSPSADTRWDALRKLQQ